MKAFLIFPLLFIYALAMSQNGHHRDSAHHRYNYDSLHRLAIQGHINENPSRMVVTIGESVGTADTLDLGVPINTRKALTISIKVFCQGSDAVGHEMVSIANIDGNCSILHEQKAIPLVGTGPLQGIKWEVKQVGRHALVMVTGVAGQTIRWFPSKKIL